MEVRVGAEITMMDDIGVRVGDRGCGGVDVVTDNNGNIVTVVLVVEFSKSNCVVYTLI